MDKSVSFSGLDDKEAMITLPLGSIASSSSSASPSSSTGMKPGVSGTVCPTPIAVPRHSCGKRARVFSSPPLSSSDNVVSSSSDANQSAATREENARDSDTSNQGQSPGKRLRYSIIIRPMLVISRTPLGVKRQLLLIIEEPCDGSSY